jgi:protein-disulfide isomerase
VKWHQVKHLDPPTEVRLRLESFAMEGREALMKWKAVLETIATLAFILTCGVLMWVLVRDRPQPLVAAAGPPGARKPRPPDPPLPAQPVSLDGAALQGRETAKVALIIYSDFQCPYCGAFGRDTLPAITKRYVASGDLLLAFRHFPLAIHPLATKAAEASECARRQDRFWDMHDRIFQHQQSLDEPTLLNYAKTLGLKTDMFEQCLAGQAAAQVKQDLESGRALSIGGTPTFFVGPRMPDGRVKLVQRLSGAAPLQQFQEVLDRFIVAERARTH